MGRWGRSESLCRGQEGWKVAGGYYVILVFQVLEKILANLKYLKSEIVANSMVVVIAI